VVVHRLLAAAIGLTPLPDQTKDKSALTALTDNLNYRNRNAQMAGRASVELHTLIFFRTRMPLVLHMWSISFAVTLSHITAVLSNLSVSSLHFPASPTDAEGRIVMVRSNGLIVFVPK
ncbi:unnamed protein product, partial [Closterium sp. NIES-53]